MTAKQRGAKCELCPLNGCDPVLATGPESGGTFAIVGDVPGQEDTDMGVPFMGKAGRELTFALLSAQIPRSQVRITHAIACKPTSEDGKLETFLANLRARNKRRRSQNLPDLMSPIECCAPRLANEIAHYDKILALGSVALRAFVSDAPGATEARGQLFTGRRNEQVFATLHPAFVLRQMRWRGIFQGDIRRALRFFTGTAHYERPTYIQITRIEQLAFVRRWIDEALAQGSIVYDVETRAAVFARKGAFESGYDPGELDEPDETPDRDGDPHFDPRLDRLNMVGFRRQDGQTLAVHRRSVDGDKRGRFFEGSEWRAMFAELLRMMESAKCLIGQNSDYYDHQVIDAETRALFGRPFSPRATFDTLLAHHVVEPDLPHSLLFIGTTMTDVHNWKAGKPASSSITDEHLADYNAIDLDVTASAARELAAAVNRESLGKAYRSDAKMQRIAVGMHRAGMPVNERIRAVWDRELQAAERAWTYGENGVYALVHANFGIDPSEFNPNRKGDARPLNIRSRDQISDLLFERLKLPIPEDLGKKDIWTQSGERSTGDAVLQAYIADPNVTAEQRAVIHALRMARRARKMWGTYAVPLTPWDSAEVEIDGDPIRFRPPRNVLWEDGKIHPDWNAGRTNIGRYASTKPNGQNWPAYEHASISLWDVMPEWRVAGKKAPGLTVKDIIAAPPGFLFVGIDADALHLRIIGSRWQVPSLLDAFLGARKHRDRVLGPHELFAGVLFGDEFWNARGWPDGPDGKWDGPAKAMRDVAKTTRYAGAYKAGVPTIHREIMSVENKKTGELIFAKIYGGRSGRSKVQALYDRWMSTEPEWEAAWKREVDIWQRDGAVIDPGNQRKLRCPDEGENEIINAPILMGETRIMHAVTQDFVDAVPFDYAGEGTGLINQCHDSLTALVPAHDAPRVAEIMNSVMNRKFPEYEIPITGKAAIGHTWQQV